MKNILKTVIALTLTCVLSANLFAGIEKINDGLYVGKKDNLYFALERVTKNTKDFWDTYAKNQHTEAIKTRNNLVQRINNDIYSNEEWDSLRTQHTVIMGTLNSIEPFQEMLQNHDKNDVWVAYISCKKITTEATNIPLKKNDIEMLVTVSTDTLIPFSTHMGIFRPLNDIKSIHKNVSMNLHSFAAQATQAAYNNKKAYMITSPMPVMREIMKKSLPKDKVYQGERGHQIPLLKKYVFTFTPFNKKINFKVPKFFNHFYSIKLIFCLLKFPIIYRKKIISLNVSPHKIINVQMPQFFESKYLMNNCHLPLVSTDIDALADFMKLD